MCRMAKVKALTVLNTRMCKASLIYPKLLDDNLLSLDGAERNAHLHGQSDC